MFRSHRVFSVLSRQLTRSYSNFPNENGTFQVRHVRIVRPFFTFKKARRVVFWGFALAFITGKFDWLFEDEEEQSKPIQVKEAVEQVKKVARTEKLASDGAIEIESKEIEEVEDDDDVPDEAPEDAWFIPCGWPKKKDRVYYKGTDPEWQSFLDFAKNQKRQEHVMNELISMIGAYHASSPRLVRILGGTPVQVTKSWLDIDYPYGPPLEYERPGIEITDDYVAWVTRPCDAISVQRIRQAISPSPLIYSLWESYRSLWDANYTRLKKAFDTDRPQPKPRSPLFAITRVEEQKNATKTEGVSISPKDKGQWSYMVPPLPEPGKEYAKASKIFRKTFSKHWNKGMSMEAPKGTIVISGMIEIQSPKTILLLDVKAAYEPRTSQWIALTASARRLQEKNQSPRG